MTERQKINILYKQGWVDPANIHHYTKDSKNEVIQDQQSHELPIDPTGCLFSIGQLTSLQNDFVEEVMLLQYHGNLLGCKVDWLPKYHPEIAGEGIGYCWGLSKL